MGTLVFEPGWPLWLIFTIAMIAAGVTILGALRQPRGAPFRLLALAALLALIANPQMRIAEKTPLDDIAVILTDESASQSLDGRDRITAEAANALEERLEGLGGVEVRRARVSGDQETRLVEGLRMALADAPRGRLGGVFIITDGQASDAPQADEISLGAPAHVLVTGRASEVDRKITMINAPRYGIVREPVKIAFRIDDLGANETPVADGGAAVVALRIDGREVLREAVPVGAEVSFEAPLERPGGLIVELEVEARSGELTTRNNIAVLPVTAIRDRLRVLLISGEPHAGERVWRNLLKSDPAVDLVHFTILRPIEKGSPTELTSELALIPFPQDELFIDKLSEFDLLIFDRYTYRGVLNAYHFDNIARYVENGGAVLIAAGPEYAGALSLAARRNLAFILPALPGGEAIVGAFRPALTEEGMRHPVTADLPEASFWGRWLRIIPVAQRSGRALMEGPDGAPLLILDRVDKGRVGLLLSDHVWLWARGFDGGGPHAELLRRIAHWLMKEPELEEEQLSLHGAGNDLVITRRTMEEGPVEVDLTRPDGEDTMVPLLAREPGLFTATVRNAQRGLYRARDGALFAVGAVGLAAAPEFENVVSSEKRLGGLGENTGGGVFSIRRADDVALPAIRKVAPGKGAYAGSGWAGLVTRNASRIDSVKDSPLAPPGLWLAILALGVIGAWWVEGRRGEARKAERP